jgi:hypothetical protein
MKEYSMLMTCQGGWFFIAFTIIVDTQKIMLEAAMTTCGDVTLQNA